jgi:hypothetical protein
LLEWTDLAEATKLGPETFTTLVRSHGPKHQLIVSCTFLSSSRARLCCFNRSTGTSGFPRLTTPQQQPEQTIVCPMAIRLVAKGTSTRGFIGLYPAALALPCPMKLNICSFTMSFNVEHIP